MGEASDRVPSYVWPGMAGYGQTRSEFSRGFVLHTDWVGKEKLSVIFPYHGPLEVLTQEGKGPVHTRMTGLVSRMENIRMNKLWNKESVNWTVTRVRMVLLGLAQDSISQELNCHFRDTARALAEGFKSLEIALCLQWLQSPPHMTRGTTVDTYTYTLSNLLQP